MVDVISTSLLSLVAFVACLVFPGERAFGQQPNTTQWPQRGWVDGGIGASTQQAIALTAGAAYSIGPAAIVARADWTGDIVGEQVEDRAFLVGLRTPQVSRFVVAGLGVARVQSVRSCEDCGETLRDPTLLALAFQAKIFAGSYWSRYGLSVYGVAGPPRVRYLAAALSLNYGWFGD